MNPMSMETYQETNSTAIERIAVTAVIGAPFAALMGVGYVGAYWLILAYLPLQIVLIVVHIFALVLCAYVIARFLVLAKIRGRFTTLLVGGIWGVLAWYVAWAVDPIARFGWNAPPLFDPNALYEYARVLYEFGSFEVGHTVVKGTRLVTSWCLEFAAFVFVPAVWALYMRSSAPFCEHCNCWTTFSLIRHYESLDEDNPLLPRLITGDLTAVRALVVFNFDDLPSNVLSSWLRFDVAICPSCTNSNYLSIAHVVPTNKGGEIAFVNQYLLKNVRISNDQVALIRQNGADEHHK
jgi:hypothetical protein